MPTVKIDSSLLGSSLWVDKPARDLYLTALLMAKPVEITEDTYTLALDSTNPSGFEVPPGRYGLVEATGRVIGFTAGMTPESGDGALERLCGPSFDHLNTHGGRRMVRVQGGFLVLDYEQHSSRDKTAKERQKRWIDKIKSNKHPTKPEKKKPKKAEKVLWEDDFAIFWEAYPRKVGKPAAMRSWMKVRPDAALLDTILAAVEKQSKSPQWVKDDGQFIPHPATWLNQQRWNDSAGVVAGAPKASEDVQASWKQWKSPPVDEGQMILDSSFESDVPFQVPDGDL